MSWWDDYPTASPIDAALDAEGVTGKAADVVRSIYQQESGSGKNTRTSNAGAVGGMQIIPATFNSVADEGWDIHNPIDNARAGVRYVKAMFDRADGDPALTAAGYYGGPGGMDKARKGVAVSDPRNPNAPDTLQYAKQVAGRLPDATEPDKWWLSFPEATEPKAPAKAVQAERVSRMEQIGHQLGLTVRAGINGVASIPAMMSDAVTGPINAGLDLVKGDGTGFRFKRAGASLNDLMDSAGVAKPQNATERVVQDAASAVAGAGGFVGAGRVLANVGSDVAKGVGSVLSAGPQLQAISAGAGAGASGIVREDGGGVGAQIAAGVAGSLAPSIAPFAAGAAVRGALRGGEAGRQATADTIAAFEAAGTTPTIGQATGGRVTRATESLLTKTPGSAGVMGEFADFQANKMAKAVQSLSDELAPNASATNAGEAIRQGVNAFKTGVKVVQKKLYANLDQYIPADTQIDVGNTTKALASLNAEIDGAANVSAMFRNSKISGIERALLADLDAAAQVGAGGLPYEAIKKLRTLVGNEISNNSLVADVPRSKWAALYGALSDDLGVAAKNAGPEAQQSWNWANQYTKTQMARLEELSGIVAKDSPEKIFNAAVSGTAEGDTVARRVISALPAQERREVAAALLQRLGRAAPGQQNAAGDAFSSETFLTNLSKLSTAARQTIFGRTDVDGVMNQLEQFATVAASRKVGGKIFANPSGTAPAAAQMGLGGAMAGGVVAAAAGQPLPLMAALAAPAGAYGLAKAATSQRLLNVAATRATLSPGAESAVVNAAAGAHGQDQPANWWESYPEQPSVIHELPIDTRTAPERISAAKTVDEAIQAAQPTDNGAGAVLSQNQRLKAEVQKLMQQAAERQERIGIERHRAERTL